MAKKSKPKEQEGSSRKPVAYKWREKLKSREEMLRYLQTAEK